MNKWFKHSRIGQSWWLVVVVGALTLALLPAADGGAAPAIRQGACGSPATPIHELQGSGPTSPAGGDKPTIEGIVVGDFQDVQRGLAGFFVQEEPSDTDADPLTSEGIFVYDEGFGVDVQPGDVVRVTGTLAEYSSDGAFLTQLRRVTAVQVCESGASVEPVAIRLPVDDVADWEAYEGMLVTLPQALVVVETYDLGRYGQVVLADGRLPVPVQVTRPGAAAQAVQAENARRRIVLDDGSTDENPDPTLFPAGGLDAENTLRAGDTVGGLTGVLDHRFGAYRVHPTAPVKFDATNPRAAAPEPVGGTLRVASFNVLNYFNGDGRGGGFPTSRGADTAEEFSRQRAKTISAILGLDADVIGLLEIENDGDGPESALADLVNGLNEQAGAGTYAYISDADGLRLPDEGADEIKVALIYRPAVVRPVGDAATTLDEPFGARRPPLAQTFEEVSSGEHFTVVINHFKSKSCTDARGENADQGDGQGCYSAERMAAAETLLDWLATDPTGSGDPDILILGDLNAYAQEDPITLLTGAGYVNLAAQFGGPEAYSYVYMGEAGTLDYALASASLAPQVTDAAEWHINADEPRALDYNVEYKSAGQVDSLYSAGPYRSSDHDPVVVGLALGGESGNGGGETTDGQASNDPTGGRLAIIGGLIAVLLAMIYGWISKRRS